jgi:rubredoxin
MMRYRCPGCGYTYDEARGDAHEGFPPGGRPGRSFQPTGPARTAR